ncbi:hypothetical protein CEXT_617811 [Caerostris extrusa]|uniref:Uncharacterized protein n=1 Tax=Caerostris extrusa TaxID=172846 RepID=A0AAV4PPZ3_CAEEX|nr:hypothetical protein CEXT_617811 [Caerostris extrusa]
MTNHSDMNGLNCGYTYHIRITRSGCAANQHAIMPFLGEASLALSMRDRIIQTQVWPIIILSPVHVRSAVRQPPTWSAIHVCENRASMTNANKRPSFKYSQMQSN